MKHRIVRNEHGKIIVQRKRWLFWFTDKQSWNDCAVVEPRMFGSLEEAEDYLANDGLTDAMVDAVYPYINGSLPLEERKEYARSALRAALQVKP